MSSCQETQARLDDWLDGVLDRTEQARVARHLRECADCRRLFEWHQEIEQRAYRLGQAADRLVSAPAGGKRVKTRRRSVLRFAAAVLLAVTTGFVAMQYRHADRPMPMLSGRGVSIGESGGSQSLSTEPPAVNEAPSEFSVTVDDSYMAVRLESSNPRIQIVWLYPMAQPEGPQGDDDGGDVNNASS